MEKNRFVLKFDNQVTRLAGYPYGKTVFEEQISKDIDYEFLPITIEFPKHIIKAASSFTQGFFESLVENFGYNLLDNQVILICDGALLESIKDNLV